MKVIKQRKLSTVVVTASLLCSTFLSTISLVSPIPVQADEANVDLSAWQIKEETNTKILTNYTGNAKDVVIPLSGDLGTTNVKITKTALREAAVSADKQGGTLTNSTNDTSRKGLVADNSTDDNPNDDVVDYSGTFKDLKQITKIDLSKLKIEAHNGEDGKNVRGDDENNGENGQDGVGEDGKNGESIDVSSMFENCESLKEVNLDSFYGRAGHGGHGGDGRGGHGGDGRDGDGSGSTGGKGGNGIGGNGGYAGDFYAQNMFKNTLQLFRIQLYFFSGENGHGGKGGTGQGGTGGKGDNGDGGKGGDGYGGKGFYGGTGQGGQGGAGDGGYKGYDDGKSNIGHGGTGGNGYGGTGYGGTGPTQAGGNGIGGVGGAIDHGCYGGKGGNGYGGNGIGYIKNSYAGSNSGYGGVGTGGTGGSGYGFAGDGGDGYGGNDSGSGGAGSGGNRGSGFTSSPGNNGNGYKGKSDPALSPENLTGEDLRLYKAYIGTTNKTDMFFPIAVKELDITKKVGFAVNELKANVSALRTVTDSGKGENKLNGVELAKVTITATDQIGNDVDLATVSKKPGKYNLTYTYDGKTVPVTLTVEGVEIVTKDLTIGTGDTWNPKDNFVCATDTDGNPLPIDQFTVTGADKVNVNQAGSYAVTYEYQDVKQTAKVNVIDIQTKKIPTLDIGETFNPYAGLASVTEANRSKHINETWFTGNVEVKVVPKGTTSPVEATTVTQTAGIYTITYTYQGVSRSVDVTVEKKELVDQSKIPTSIDFGKIPIQYQTTDEVTGKTNGQATTASIQVKDTRSESGEGYQLKVHQNQVFMGKNTNKPLNASLSFKSGTITNSEKHSISGGNQSITLTPGEDKIVLTANKGESRGTTTMPLTDFKLSIPKESEKLKDTYQTTLTWTLSDAP